MGLFGFGKKKDRPSPQLADDAYQARYGGRPLLLILDNYILDCLGLLPPDKNANLAVMVKKAFGGGDDWKKTVRDTIKVHDSIDDSIRTRWSHFQTNNS